VGLEEILQSMAAKAEFEREAIISAARQEAERIVARARADADAARASALETELRRLRSEQARRLNDVRLEGLRAVASAREALLDEAFRECSSRLRGLRSDPSYPSIFAALLDEAVTELGSRDLLIDVDPADETLARSLCADRGLSAVVRPSLCSAGGLDVGTVDGRIVVRNTIERRLTRAREALRAELLAMLDDGPSDGRPD